MHFKVEPKPRYVTKKKGKWSCGEHPAGPHTVNWIFYKTKGLGGMKPVGNYKFNATGFAGQQVTFDWYQD
jgi:hypothetical protein